MRLAAKRVRRIIGDMADGETKIVLADRRCSGEYVQKVGEAMNLYVEAERQGPRWIIKRFGPWTKPGDAERYRLLG